MSVDALASLHARLVACRRCRKMKPPVVHGLPVPSPVYLLGQAPGAKEGPAGKPFAWTAGKTLFRWFNQTLGVDEEMVRERVYFAAVARCFPGKNPKGGDRKPDDKEIERCRAWIAEELPLLRPRLVLPVGAMAIEQVLGHGGQLKEVVGTLRTAMWHGVRVDVICLPHPSGLSTWHVTEPGRTLLVKALRLLRTHPAIADAFSPTATSSS